MIVSVRLLSFYYGGQTNIYHTYKKAWVHLITVHAPACSKSRSEQSWLAIACFGLFIFRAVQKADRADVAHSGKMGFHYLARQFCHNFLTQYYYNKKLYFVSTIALVILKFEAEGREFKKFFSITSMIYSNSERSEQFLVTGCFLTCS